MRVFNLKVITSFGVEVIYDTNFVWFNTHNNKFATKFTNDDDIYDFLIKYGFDLDGSPYA
jgi:hypothetical protein